MSSQKPFRFEQADGNATLRSEEHAEDDLATLLDRLGMTPPQQAKIGPELRRLLVKYCMEVIGNIAWYQAARAKAERALSWARFLVVMAIAGAAAALGGVVLVNDQIVTAQIGTMVVAVLVILQVIASSSDKKAQVGAFWRASSDLKEALYTFEHTWAGKVVGTDGEIVADFETALWQEVVRARRIARDERDAYFDTFRSPTEIVNIAAAPLDALRTRGVETAAFQLDAIRTRKMEADAAGRPVADARQQLIEAKARLAAANAKARALEEAKAGDAELSAARAAVLDARAEVVRTSEQLRLLAKAALLNPT